MGHGVDFGAELAVNHRRIREAAADSAAPGGTLAPTLRRHLDLLRRHVLPAVTHGVPGGGQIAATDEVMLSGIERQLDEGDQVAPGQGRGRGQARQAAVLLDLIEVQLSWEDQVLLPLLEAETTWIVLEDLADHTRLARQ